MKRLLLLAPCAALTFACSGGANNAGAGTNAAGNNGADAATGGVNAASGNGNASGSGSGATTGAATVRAGQWETSAQLISIDMPGASPQAVEQARAQMAGLQQPKQQCWTEAEVGKIAEELANFDPNAGCEFSRRIFSGGTIDIAGRCSSGGTGLEMTMAGTFTADTFLANADLNATGGPQPVRIRMKTSGRRIGDCPG